MTILRTTPFIVAPSPYTKRHPAREHYRPDLGLYMRSSWEANFARLLNYETEQGIVTRWEYEPDIFIFDLVSKGTRAYVPDFKVWSAFAEEPSYVEVKGYMDAKSRLKLKRMARYYPDVEVLVIGSKEYREIDRNMQKLPHWE